MIITKSELSNNWGTVKVYQKNNNNKMIVEIIFLSDFIIVCSLKIYIVIV